MTELVLVSKNIERPPASSPPNMSGEGAIVFRYDLQDNGTSVTLNGSFCTKATLAGSDAGWYRLNVQNEGTHAYTRFPKTDWIDSAVSASTGVSRAETSYGVIGTVSGKTYNKTKSTQYVPLYCSANLRTTLSFMDRSWTKYRGASHDLSIVIPPLASYAVTYDANGGSGAPASQTKWYAESLTLQTATPTRTGYRFNGWNTARDGSGTSYSAGDNYTTNAPLALYAQWELQNLVKVYDENGVAHTGLVTVYDANGNAHACKITAYDNDGNKHGITI